MRERKCLALMIYIYFLIWGMEDCQLAPALLSAVKRDLGRWRVKQVYLGNEESDEKIKVEVNKYIDSIQLTEYSHSDLVNKVIELLKNNTVVGLFQGQMEYGRGRWKSHCFCIIVMIKGANDWLNKRLKRTEFMPFAPVTTKEIAPLFLWVGNRTILLPTS